MTINNKNLKSKHFVLTSLIFYFLIILTLRINFISNEFFGIIQKLYFFLEILFAAGLVAIFISRAKINKTNFSIIIVIISIFSLLSSLDIFYYIEMLFDGFSFSDIFYAIKVTFEIGLRDGFIFRTKIIPIIIIFATVINFNLTISKKINIKAGIITPILVNVYYLFLIFTNFSMISFPFIFRLLGEIAYQISLVLAFNFFINNEEPSNVEIENMISSNTYISENNGNELKDNLSISMIKEVKNIGYCIFMSFLTFGIYLIFWLNSMIKKIRNINGESIDSTGELLALVFIPFYSIYWVYSRSQKLYFSSKKLNVQLTDNSVINLILSLFGLSIVSYAIIQNDLNTIALSYSSSSNEIIYKEDELEKEKVNTDNLAISSLTNIELLSKLSDLKDKGIITEEEFLNKKRELLEKI